MTAFLQRYTTNSSSLTSSQDVNNLQFHVHSWMFTQNKTSGRLLEPEPEAFGLEGYTFMLRPAASMVLSCQMLLSGVKLSVESTLPSGQVGNAPWRHVAMAMHETKPQHPLPPRLPPSTDFRAGRPNHRPYNHVHTLDIRYTKHPSIIQPLTQYKHWCLSQVVHCTGKEID